MSRTSADMRGGVRNLFRTQDRVRLQTRRLGGCSASGDLAFHQRAPSAEYARRQRVRASEVSVRIDWRANVSGARLILSGARLILLAPLDDHIRRNFKMKLQAVNSVADAKGLVPAGRRRC